MIERLVFQLSLWACCVTLFSGCTYQATITSPSSGDIISGSVLNITKAQSSFAAANACTNGRVHLYSINSSGQKDKKILSTDINAEGEFELTGLRQYGIDFSKNVFTSTQHLLEFECDNTFYQRFVTGSKDQDINEGTSLISWVSQTGADSKITQQPPELWTQFYTSLLNADSMTAAFTTLSSDATLKAKFESAFGITVNDLTNAVPQIRSTQVPGLFKENITQALSVQATHWSADYQTAYLWKIGSETLSTQNNFNYAPSANSQGQHTLQLFVGQKNNLGNLDTTKPYAQKTFDINISNDVLPTPPTVTRLSAAYVNASNTAVQVRMNTGSLVDGRPFNCRSFSGLAVTEDSYPGLTLAPSLSSSYNIDCTQSPTQNVNLTLSQTEGRRLIRLWAMDAAGNKSLNSENVEVVFDSQDPQLNLTSITSGEILKGGSSVIISWNSTEINPATNPIHLQYSANNGTSWQNIASNLADSGSYTWTVPSINTSQALLRVSMTDLAGNTGSAESSQTFTIDSLAPAAPAVTRSSPAITNASAATFTVANCTDRSHVFYSETNTVPALTDTGWAACSTSSSYSHSLNGEGPHTVYVWARDLAGNISATSGSFTVTLDQTGPALSLTSLTGGEVISGNTYLPPAGGIKNITWSASDVSGLATNPIKLEYTVNNETSWSEIASHLANAGTYSWTIPAENSSQAKIKITACDSLGNCSHKISTSTFTIDSAAPVVSSISINDGAAMAGTSLLNVKINLADNFSAANSLQIRLGLAHTTTGECQSEFVNSGWSNWVSATTAMAFNVAPIDGIKKVCVWTKDSIGNISKITTNAGAGTDTLDFDAIDFQIGTPPKILSFQATNGTAGANVGTETYTVGNIVNIQWSLEDQQGLDNNPVSIAYTTDNTVWKDIISNQNIIDDSKITWFGGLSGNPTSSVGSYTSWTAPSAGYFRLKIVAKDNAGNTSIPALSQSQNTGNWSIFAGSTERGDGGTGTSALLYGPDVSLQHFAIHPKTNDIYAVDNAYGIRKLDVKTGKVSTILFSGSSNLSSTGGALPATPTLPIGSGAIMNFDHNGLLYIKNDLTIFQIDLENRTSSKYLGGGTDNGSLESVNDVYFWPSSFTFDESNSLYFFVDCNPSLGNPGEVARPYRIAKVTQNPTTRKAETLQIVAGSCASTNAPTGLPLTAKNNLLGNIRYPGLSSIVAFDNGNSIYFTGYSNSVVYKILNGVLYTTGIAPTTIGYDFKQKKLYGVINSALQLINRSATNGGETLTSIFGSATITPGCADEGAASANVCLSGGRHEPRFDSSGTIYLPAGSANNNTAPYRIQYLTADSKIRSIFGSKAFFGDGLNKGLVRGNFGGIYYKKSTELAQTGFPSGLYFMDYSAGVFGFINPGTAQANILWGDQSRTALPAQGTTISKNHSMFTPYSGGSLMPLTFDKNGLPWTRVGTTLVRINEDHTISYYFRGSTYWDKVVHGETGINNKFYTYVYGASTNLTFDDNGPFFIGSAYVNLIGGVDPIPQITHFNLNSDTATKVMGGIKKQSETPATSSDKTAGATFSAELPSTCNGRVCKAVYEPTTDTLYFTEGPLLRAISKPLIPAQSTLTTLFTHTTTITQFILSEDKKQIWYYTSGSLRCFDISSGKSWCNHSNLYPHSGTLGSLPDIPNTMTWKDSGTLLISIGNKILQYKIPTTP